MSEAVTFTIVKYIQGNWMKGTSVFRSNLRQLGYNTGLGLEKNGTKIQNVKLRLSKNQLDDSCGRHYFE